MKNRTTVSRLACLTIVLAAGTMMATANIATAKDNHHQGNNAQNNGHQRGAMSGQPAGVKTALREQKKCRKHCGKPTQTSTDKKPTTTSPKPAVSDQPANAKSAASSPPTTATVSNGVNTSAIFNGKDGLTVTAASPTSITVTNSSHSSVTMGGEFDHSVRRDIGQGRPGHGGSPPCERRRHDRHQACGCRRTNKTDPARSWPRRHRKGRGNDRRHRRQCRRRQSGHPWDSGWPHRRRSGRRDDCRRACQRHQANCQRSCRFGRGRH